MTFKKNLDDILRTVYGNSNKNDSTIDDQEIIVIKWKTIRVKVET